RAHPGAHPARLGWREDRLPLPRRRGSGGAEGAPPRRREPEPRDARPRERPAEGVIPHPERRSRETDSLVVRDELAKLRNVRACPECGGARLRREARHVKIAGQTIYEISSWPLRATQDFF